MACDVGESPCWDAETGSLLFVDITPGRIHRLDTRSGHRSSFEVGQEAGAVVLGEEGGLVIAARDGIIACGFGDARDADAVAILTEQYPGRRVVAVDARPLFARGGGIPCITLHQPSAR